MDQTQLFKASVKTVRLRNKSIVQPDKTQKYSGKIKLRDEFLIKANDVRYQVTKLRNLLIENRAAYMRFGYHLKTSSQMSDEERNIIDTESEKIITICTKYIDDLKAECLKTSNNNTNKQLIQHKLAVLDILSNYLKEVFRIHKEQKESRIQHELDTYKLLKLESNKKLIPITAPKERNKNDITKYLNGDDYDSETDDSISTRRDSKSKQNSNRLNISESEVAIAEDQAYKYALEDDDSVSPDDIQMFESENKQLLSDLKGLSDEVDQIEKNVVGIARLQEIFTEKVNQSFYLTIRKCLY